MDKEWTNIKDIFLSTCNEILWKPETGRSCCDQIATLGLITEQSLEWKSLLYMTFVDFKKAFDSVDQATLWSFLRHYGVPDKMVRMIKVMHDGFEASVTHDGTTTQGFEVKTGVK